MLRGTALTPKVSCLENRESESDGKLTCSKRLPFSGSFIFIRIHGYIFFGTTTMGWFFFAQNCFLSFSA